MADRQRVFQQMLELIHKGVLANTQFGEVWSIDTLLKLLPP